LTSSKTEVSKATQGSLDDLKIGDQVAIFGQENPDKSYSATTIQLNPFFRNTPERSENNQPGM
jgi:hypothetical protein